MYQIILFLHVKECLLVGVLNAGLVDQKVSEPVERCSVSETLSDIESDPTNKGLAIERTGRSLFVSEFSSRCVVQVLPSSRHLRFE